MNITPELIVAALGVISGIGGGFFAWLKAREMTDLRVRLAEIESRDNAKKLDHEADKRDDEKDMAWLTAITTQTTLMQTMVNTLQRQSEEISTIVEPVQQMHLLMSGARREMQGVTPLLNEIKTAVESVPSVTAERIKDEMRQTLEGIRNLIVSAALQLDTISNKLDCWEPDAKLSASEPGEPAPQTPETKEQPAQEG